MTVRRTGSTIPSPCTQRCSLDPISEVCRSCGRHLDEITAWAGADDDERSAIISRALERRKAV